MKLLLFNNIDEYKKFFDSAEKNMEDDIEYRVFKNFSANRILILAEHAFSERIAVPECGKGAYMGIGDKNTDMLARMAAFYSGAAYIIPWLSRRKIDFARDPEMVGKDNKLLAAISHSKPQQKRYITIHRDEGYLPVLLKYAELIKKLEPKFILSYHGMHRRHPSDISIGAGPDFAYLGGKAKTWEFVKYSKEKINEKIKELGFKFPLDIRMSRIFAGNINYTLAKYSKKGAICCQVEFNLRGRTSSKLGMPKRKFQLAGQLLPQCMKEFYGK